jgi:putative hemolysin
VIDTGRLRRRHRPGIQDPYIIAMTSQILATTTSVATAPSYSILVAGTPDEVSAVQRLRHQVFAQELGARLHSPVAGLDIDEFDPYCDHLLIREDGTGEVVATYRLLPPNRAREIGRLYSDSEFELTGLVDLRDAIVEAGRSCVHPDHRTGAVINLMWTGIARYLHLHGHRWLAGCASVPVADGGAAAACVWEVTRAKHLAPPRLRVAPRRPYPLPPVPTTDRAQLLAAVPPLLRGYLRLGAWIGGEPAYDADWDVADFFVLLSLDRLDERYLKHFLGDMSTVDGTPS